MKLRTSIALALAAVALLAAPAPGQSAPAANSADHELAAITARGAMLAAYDQAIRYATREVLLNQPPTGKIERYIARESTTGWTVDFGRLSPDGAKFLTAYEAVQADTPTHFAVGQFDPERQDTGFNLTAARAIDLALRDFGRFPQLYAVAVLPAGKQVLVYLYPAQTKEGVYPYGGDVRYLVSNDGAKIDTKWQMHKAIAESIAPPIPATAPTTEVPTAATPPADTPAAVTPPAQNAAVAPPPVPTPASILPPQSHTDDAQSTLPEDTDVMLVLRRQPPIPEFVTAGGHIYKINTDGTILPNPPDAPPPPH